MAKQQITVPDIGGAEGAEVIELLVAVGDEVALEQGLIVLESDKASMEIPSTAAGTVVELLVSEGEELSEGSVIAVVETGAADSPSEAAAEATEPAAPEPDQPAAATEPEPEPAPAAAPAAAAPSEQTVAVPDIGTDDAVDLIELSVAVGDRVAEGDSLVVLESDKASMEVPAPFAGEVVRLLVEEGGQVRQGDPLMVMLTETAPVAAAEPAASASEPASSKSPEPAQSGSPEAAQSRSPAPAQSRSPEPATGGTSPGAQPGPAAASGGTVYAGPAVRKLARELGVDLTAVGGTGPRGRIVKEDLHRFVQDALKKPAPAAVAGTGIPPIPEPDFSAFGSVEAGARSKMDKVTAANMHRSWLNVPHVTQFDDADITDLEDFRAGLKAEAEARGTRLTPLPFLLKACAVALRDNPRFRTSLADGGETLVSKQYTHIGMAVDTPAGLLVPVIRDVDRKTLWQLAEEVLELAGRARDRKLKPQEMQGGCFTISSLGNIGGTGFTPIVNAPEVGILGVSRADIRPVWDGADFQPRKLLPLALSYDHRVINGGDAGRFLTQLVGLLADIRRLAL